MGSKLGALFLKRAHGPTGYAARLIMSKKVAAGLAELTGEALYGSVELGVMLVSQAAGMSKSEVANVLPMAELRTLAERIGEEQKVVATQWDLHTGHAGGLLDGVADLLQPAHLCALVLKVADQRGRKRAEEHRPR